MKTISQEEFDDRLHAMVERMTSSQILSYGDVYMILAEELNNAIIEEWEKEQTTTQAERDAITQEGPQQGDIISDDLKVWCRVGRNNETFLCGSLVDVRNKLASLNDSANIWQNTDKPTLLSGS
jgi:hypothetical protein